MTSPERSDATTYKEKLLNLFEKEERKMLVKIGEFLSNPKNRKTIVNFKNIEKSTKNHKTLIEDYINTKTHTEEDFVIIPLSVLNPEEEEEDNDPSDYEEDKDVVDTPSHKTRLKNLISSTSEEKCMDICRFANLLGRIIFPEDEATTYKEKLLNYVENNIVEEACRLLLAAKKVLLSTNYSNDDVKELPLSLIPLAKMFLDR